MNIYQRINEVTDYIEGRLDEAIDYDLIARKMGVNLCTMRKIFALLTGVSIAEYIRRRRLSLASYDLRKGLKVTDVAIKYQYDSAAAFSRAFKKFHGILPSEVMGATDLKNFPKIYLDEEMTSVQSQAYRIVKKVPFTLYGFSMGTSLETIAVDAPEFFREIMECYGHPDYGMVSYDADRRECLMYSVLFATETRGAKTIVFPQSDWLVFRISSQEAKDIQEQSRRFYREFLPSCMYNLRELPELEYYHDGITDFMVPVEKI